MAWLLGLRAPYFRVMHVSAEAKWHPTSPSKAEVCVAFLINVDSWESLSTLLSTSLLLRAEQDQLPASATPYSAVPYAP